MDTVKITLELPADDARNAEEFGLLDPEAITSLLRDELDRRIMEFVNSEIKAYRAEKRAAQSQQNGS